MNMSQLSSFAPVIRSLSAAELNGAPSLFDKLRLAQSDKLDVCYAPFEFINPEARVVLVGITPGKQQMLNAIGEARRQLDMSRSYTEVLIAAKRVGGFSGDIRGHLINLLDHIGLNRWLSISSCAELFGRAATLVQTASVLRNPVFYQGSDYRGTPKMTRNTLLREQLLAYFAQDVRDLPNAILIPLGDTVADALKYLADNGYVDRRRILAGLPHPSPQNIERIKYFLGQKSRSDLSVKTNPDKLDLARSTILRQIEALS